MSSPGRNYGQGITAMFRKANRILAIAAIVGAPLIVAQLLGWL